MSAANPFESYSGPGTPPVGCAALTLPATTNPNCPADYKAYEGEIVEVWFVSVTETSGVFAATDTPTNYLYKGDLDAITGVKKLTVIGDKPLGEARVLSLAKRWTIVKDRGHSVNIDVTDMSVANYEFVRTLQHGSKVAIWWRSIDGWHCGGADGIICDVSTAGIIWPRGEGSLMTGNLVLTWQNKYDPPAGLGIDGVSPLTAAKGGKTPDALTAKDVKAA